MIVVNFRRALPNSSHQCRSPLSHQSLINIRLIETFIILEPAVPKWDATRAAFILSTPLRCRRLALPLPPVRQHLSIRVNSRASGTLGRTEWKWVRGLGLAGVCCVF